MKYLLLMSALLAGCATNSQNKNEVITSLPEISKLDCAGKDEKTCVALGITEALAHLENCNWEMGKRVGYTPKDSEIKFINEIISNRIDYWEVYTLKDPGIHAAFDKNNDLYKQMAAKSKVFLTNASNDELGKYCYDAMDTIKGNQPTFAHNPFISKSATPLNNDWIKKYQ